MILHIYTTKPPTGRCVLFAHKLAGVAGSAPIIQIAERLWWGKFPPEEPAVIHVKNQAALNDLLAISAEYGICVKTIDEESGSSNPTTGTTG